MIFINLHAHCDQISKNIITIVHQEPKKFDAKILYYSIGIHPWYINEKDVDEELKIIEEKMQLKNALALGECGLDKKIAVPLAVQLDVLEKQLILAEKYNKPVILHCVGAFQEMIEIKKRLKITIPMIIHGFSKKFEVAKSLTNNGFYLSFGKNLVNNPLLQDVFLNVPEKFIFLETDVADVSIEAIYALASEVKKSHTNALQQIILTNFETVFAFETNQ